MEQIKHNPTTNKIFSSRIIKFALIGIFCLMVIKGVNLWLYTWITNMVASGIFMENEVSEEILLKILGILDIGIVGGITTIVTAVIARYGLRESTGNIGAGMQSMGGNQSSDVPPEGNEV